MNTIHPQDAGFTSRTEWHGREAVYVWRCCNEDAIDGRVRVDIDGVWHQVTVLRCKHCERTNKVKD